MKRREEKQEIEMKKKQHKSSKEDNKVEEKKEKMKETYEYRESVNKPFSAIAAASASIASASGAYLVEMAH